MYSKKCIDKFLSLIYEIDSEPAAIEVTRGVSWYNKLLFRSECTVKLYVVVRTPSKEHPQFKECEIESTNFDQLESLRGLGKTLSTKLNVVFHSPVVTPDDFIPRWKDQFEKNEIEWRMQWTIDYWSSEGGMKTLSGCLNVNGICSSSAIGQTHSYLSEIFNTPFSCKIENLVVDDPFEMDKYGYEKISLPKGWEIRKLFLESVDLISTFNVLSGNFDKYVNAMLCVSLAFDTDLKKLAFLYEYKNKLIPEAKAKDLLENVINFKREDWNLRYQLREDFNSNVPPSDSMRRHGITFPNILVHKEFRLKHFGNYLSDWPDRMSDQEFDEVFIDNAVYI